MRPLLLGAGVQVPVSGSKRLRPVAGWSVRWPGTSVTSEPIGEEELALGWEEVVIGEEADRLKPA